MPGLLKKVIASFHTSKEPLVLNVLNNCAVAEDGGLWSTRSARISLLPSTNAWCFSSVQPNCLYALSAFDVNCKWFTHVVTYDIISSVLISATPFDDICFLSSSLEVTADRGIVNSFTPSCGKCNRTTTASPTSESSKRRVTYKSL